MLNLISAILIGIATYYGPGFQGNLTYSGEPYNMYDISCASNSYPMNTILHVTDLENNKTVDCRVNDKGAFRYPILVDLSYAAFSVLDNPSKGVIKIEVQQKEVFDWKSCQPSWWCSGRIY